MKPVSSGPGRSMIASVWFISCLFPKPRGTKKKEEEKRKKLMKIELCGILELPRYRRKSQRYILDFIEYSGSPCVSGQDGCGLG